MGQGLLYYKGEAFEILAIFNESGAASLEEFFGLCLLFWEKQGGVERFSCPAILRDGAVAFYTYSLCRLEIGMEGCYFYITVCLKIGLESAKLDGRAVEDSPGHGNKGYAKGGAICHLTVEVFPSLREG